MNINAAHLVRQNEVALASTSGKTFAADQTKQLATVGCAMCVGVALWKSAGQHALLAHIQPDDLESVRAASEKIKTLLPDPDKASYATAGNGEDTEQIIGMLAGLYPGIRGFPGRDELSIDLSNGVMRASNNLAVTLLEEHAADVRYDNLT